MKTSKKRSLRSICVAASGFLLLSLCGVKETNAFSFAPGSPSYCPSYSVPSHWRSCSLRMSESDDLDSNDQAPQEAPAGSFFHKVPSSDDRVSSIDENEGNIDNIANDAEERNGADDFDDQISKLIRQRRKKPLSSRPSTINGVPTEKATGFGKPKNGNKSSKTNNKPITPYVAIGTPDQPINDPSKPERDDQGYTLYTDTQTGEKSRVFEALVDYPSTFTMKIVGANEGTFVMDIVALVAEACETDVKEIKHATRVMGKWVSVTVKAPVESAEMLYSLYEKVDLDPRVKFKF